MQKDEFIFILEAGVNHDGNLERALELVRQAAQTGADFIKFQTYSAAKIAAEKSPSYWDLNEEATQSQIELFSKYDSFSREDYFMIARECSRLSIGFMTTCFDTDWVEELDPIIPIYKIASADITNFQLLESVAKKKKPMILSTGAASLTEIHKTLEFMSKFKIPEISLLHCVLNYPTHAERAALGRIKILANEFPKFTIGYSDHTKSDVSNHAIQMAYNFGARIFEKHFTWDKTAYGNDHYHSFDQQDASRMINTLRKLILMERYDEESFLENQKSARTYARRGLYASRDLCAGESLSAKDVIPLRPPIGSDGLDGNDFHKLLGSTLNTDVSEGSPFLRSYFE